MKLIKGSILGLVLVAMAGLIGSAFTLKEMEGVKKNPTFYYYLLRESGNPYMESDYTVREEYPPAPCGGDSEVCWIKAEDNGNEEPEITEELEGEIDDALSGHDDTDNVKLRN